MFVCCTRLKLIDRDVRACRVLPKCLCHRIQAPREQAHVWFTKPTDFHLTGKRKQRVHIGLSSFHRERIHSSQSRYQTRRRVVGN